MKKQLQTHARQCVKDKMTRRTKLKGIKYYGKE